MYNRPTKIKNRDHFDTSPSILMNDRSRKGPAEAATRYSKSIPPEYKGVIVKGKTSGVFKRTTNETLTKQLEQLLKTYGAFQNIPGEKRREWYIGGTLLKTYEAWKLLPPEVTDRESLERNEMLAFLAGEKINDQGEKKYGPLPSADAIIIEIGRLVLDYVEEWTGLSEEKQHALERTIIQFISQKHEEFDRIPKPSQEKPQPSPEEMRIRLLSSSLAPPADKAPNHEELNEWIRLQVLKKIGNKIIELAWQHDKGIFAEDNEDEDEKFGETVLVDVSRQTSARTLRAIEPEETEKIAEPETVKAEIDPDETPTVPAGPLPKRILAPDKK